MCLSTPLTTIKFTSLSSSPHPLPPWHDPPPPPPPSPPWCRPTFPQVVLHQRGSGSMARAAVGALPWWRFETTVAAARCSAHGKGSAASTPGTTPPTNHAALAQPALDAVISLRAPAMESASAKVCVVGVLLLRRVGQQGPYKHRSPPPPTLPANGRRRRRPICRHHGALRGGPAFQTTTLGHFGSPY